MTQKLIGYIAWDFATDTPKSGTRRFKVWTSVKECYAKHGFNETSNRYGVKPIHVEVDA